MATKSPVFPMPEPQHFSDYGFDPQIDYFQVLEEARRHKREAWSTRSIDTLHFKLQKPISKDDHYHLSKKKKSAVANKKRRWWKSALFFFKSRLSHYSSKPINPAASKSMPIGPSSISGPIYITESLSGSATPFRGTTSRPSSGPLAGTLTPARKSEFEIPYVSLREFNMDEPPRISAPSPIPIYLVT